MKYPSWQIVADAIREVFCMKQNIHDECCVQDMQKTFINIIKAATRDFLSVEMGKYVIPCRDRISVRINKMKLRGDNGIIQPIQLENASFSCGVDDSLIILILESPSKDEYNCKKVKQWPEPARGQTGRNINQYFVPLVKNDFKNWRIGLINPIQYSCSIGKVLPPTIRDKVFSDLFKDEIKDYFVYRLELMCKCKEHIIVNCCTSCNSSKIDDILIDKKIPFLKMAHPSSPCFAKQCRESREGNCSSCCKVIWHKPTENSYVFSAMMLSADGIKKVLFSPNFTKK